MQRCTPVAKNRTNNKIDLYMSTSTDYGSTAVHLIHPSDARTLNTSPPFPKRRGLKNQIKERQVFVMNTKHIFEGKVTVKKLQKSHDQDGYRFVIEDGKISRIEKGDKHEDR